METSPIQERSAGPSLTVAAVARRLGVAPATLRTWDRRYGLGPSDHTAGSHRRYSGNDIARLMVMRRLTLEGVAPSEAARAALASPDGAGSDVRVPSTADVMDAYSDAVPMAADPRALAAAAAHFDNAAVRWMLTRVHPRDTLAWWSDLLEPAMRVVAERSSLERPGENVGPTLVAAAFAELRSRAAVSASRLTDDGAATVLVIPAVDGGDLLAHVLATTLQANGVRARVLASTLPAVVAGVVERAVPAAVLLEVPDGAESVVAQVVRAVVAGRPALPLFVHHQGAGIPDMPVAANVNRVRSLTGALHEVLATVRLHPPTP
jgi:DNA-binding transcriptional MerR regulator